MASVIDAQELSARLTLMADGAASAARSWETSGDDYQKRAQTAAHLDGRAWAFRYVREHTLPQLLQEVI